MIFTEPLFLFAFLPIVIFLFLFVRAQQLHCIVVPLLLVSSLIFYGHWHWQFIFLLLASIGGNYFVAKSLINRPNKRLVYLAVIANLSLLGYYKYAGFFMQNLSMLGFDNQFDPPILPLAISFFTFQQIAFVVDAHRQQISLTSLSRYSLFVSFFPQLIAGPIVNYRDMQPQIDALAIGKCQPLYVMGMLYLLMGLAKKLIIADPLSEIINPLFLSADSTGESQPVVALIAMLGYTFQLYFDFSAYADMAIGIGLLFGLTLPINFNSPYKSASIIDFWRRWHITLSTFLKNYLYIPMGGGRCSVFRRHANLFVTMLLGGLWHGASWNFVLWGGGHGAMLIINHAFRNVCTKYNIHIPSFVMSLFILLTFCCVSLAWVPFRAQTFDGAYGILSSLTLLPTISIADIQAVQFVHGVDLLKAFGLLLLATVIAFYCPNTHQIIEKLRALPLRRKEQAVLMLKHPIFALVSGVAVFGVGKMMLAMPTAAFLYFNF